MMHDALPCCHFRFCGYLRSTIEPKTAKREETQVRRAEIILCNNYIQCAYFQVGIIALKGSNNDPGRTVSDVEKGSGHLPFLDRQEREPS